MLAHPNNDDVQTHLDRVTRDGYSVIPGGFGRAQAASLLEAVRRLNVERHRAPDSAQPFLNRGHDMLYNLHAADLSFVRAFTRNPTAMAVMRALLNDEYYRQIPADRPNFILRALVARSSGRAPLPLHIDSFIPSSGSHAIACQVALILEDQTPDTGCTLVVPGSHRSDEYADQGALSKAVPVATRAGDVVIWDSRLWHGAMGNTTSRSRWSLIATFVRWWLKQNFDVTGTLPQSIYAALDDDEKTILGFCSRPPRDEHERIDMKTGHDQLQDDVAAYRRG